jgi:predicted Kef-type K+ transport protein
VQAVVIAAALSMSSSAFVLQLLSERGESATRTGSATLGILLFQVRWTVVAALLLPLCWLLHCSCCPADAALADPHQRHVALRGLAGTVTLNSSRGPCLHVAATLRCSMPDV